MVAGGILSLASALASTPEAGDPRPPLASTYDQAVCEQADAPVACASEAPPPAVLDCNDAVASVWVGGMIGSGDMPPASAGLRARAPSEPRVFSLQHPRGFAPPAGRGP